MKNYMMRNESNSPEAMFQNVDDKIFSPIFYDENRSWMKTDVKETDDQYIMEIELPGFKKENIAIDYEDGYVTINASRESKESNDKFICKERCVKSCSFLRRCVPRSSPAAVTTRSIMETASGSMLESIRKTGWCRSPCGTVKSSQQSLAITWRSNSMATPVRTTPRGSKRLPRLRWAQTGI